VFLRRTSAVDCLERLVSEVISEVFNGTLQSAEMLDVTYYDKVPYTN